MISKRASAFTIWSRVLSRSGLARHSSCYRNTSGGGEWAWRRGNQLLAQDSKASPAFCPDLYRCHHQEVAPGYANGQFRGGTHRSCLPRSGAYVQQ
jgi:hypothetical protein